MWPRLIREPLFQFLLGGAALFGLNALISAHRSDGLSSDTRIELSAADQAQMLDGGTAALDAWVREEALVREAISLGLDRGDSVVRQRLAQKMEFVLSDGAEVKEPTPNEVRARFDAQPERYRAAATVSLSQLFFSRASRGSRAEADAAAALADPERAVADAFAVPSKLEYQSALDLTAAFGASFASRVLTLPVGSWQGPIASTFGAHVVRIDARQQAPSPTFEEVESQVRDELMTERRRAAEEAAFARLRAKYTVSIGR